MAVKRWNGTSWEIYAGSDLAPVKVTDGRVGKTTFIGATTPTGMVDGDIWIDQDTATNAVVPTALLAKGDIFAATGNAAYTRLAAGNNGESLFADSSTSTGLRWQGDYNTGKNKILNGDFSIWQRGTSFSSIGNGSYSADRWVLAANKTTTITQQAFTPGTAPVSGYEGQYFLRAAWSADGSYAAIATRLEDCRLFAGQTVTLSYWAKSNINVTNNAGWSQYFGAGGSSQISGYADNTTITTSWQRFTYTFTVPSISGKTIGASNYFIVQPILIQTSSAYTIDIWGVQLEAGSIATPFTTNTGNPQAELAACQRYYNRWTAANGGSAYAFIHAVWAYSTTQAFGLYTYPVPMRVTPSLETTGTASNYRVVVGNSFITCSGVPALDQANPYTMNIQYPVSSGLTVGQAGVCGPNNNNIAYLGFSAEL